VTFKDLKRFLQKNDSAVYDSSNQDIQLQIERFAIIRYKPFWISDIKEHKKANIGNKGNCCFNHIIGLPKKDGHD
jgi:hypothetical protein